MCGPFLLWGSVYYKKMNPAEFVALPGSLNLPPQTERSSLGTIIYLIPQQSISPERRRTNNLTRQCRLSEFLLVRR